MSRSDNGEWDACVCAIQIRLAEVLNIADTIKITQAASKSPLF